MRKRELEQHLRKLCRKELERLVNDNKIIRGEVYPKTFLDSLMVDHFNVKGEMVDTTFIDIVVR